MLEENSKRLRNTADSTSTDIESQDDELKAGRQSSPKVALSSNLQASLTLFKSFIGTGILALPFAYKIAGVWLGALGTVIIGIMLTHCFLLLLETANDRFGQKRISFQKLAVEILGDKGRYLVQIPLIIEQLGCCIGILIFTRTFLNHVLCSFNVELLCDNMGFNVLFALFLTVPLSLINNMHYFYIPSLAANVFIIVGLVSQMFYNSQVIHENPEIGSAIGSTFREFNLTSFHLFFGVALFSFEGVGVTFSIRDSMEKPGDLPKLLKKQMTILTVIYIVFAVTSCIALGNSLQDIVFFSLPTDQPFYLLIQILYAVSVLFTYPIQLFPALRIIENSNALRVKLFGENGKSKNLTLRYTLRLFIIAIVFLIAYSAQSFHLFLNLLGSCVFTFLGFILPIWLYTVQYKGRINKKTMLMNFSILTITIFFGVIGFVSSLSELVSLKSTVI